MADHGFLHLQRGVFGHRQVAGHQSGDGGAPCLAQQQGGLGVDVDEHDLNRGRVGLVARRHFGDAVEQQLKPPGQVAQCRRSAGACGADGAAGHVAQVVAVQVHHAEAGGLQAGVDAKDAHGVSPCQGNCAEGMRARMVRARCAR
ncbi:hypothetical protein SDC9_199180 [bioreactor metagenome]|uniref:Uncharacterized protein n=1 Tax=bioreactor metagenome TaxID=1076179 RepID=A0A645IL16_9ZZZZ